MRAFTVAACLWLSLTAGAPTQQWDFVPGERLLLYDDFTDMRPGSAPPPGEVRGGRPGGF
jgi:hypothetical protein